MTGRAAWGRVACAMALGAWMAAIPATTAWGQGRGAIQGAWAARVGDAVFVLEFTGVTGSFHVTQGEVTEGGKLRNVALKNVHISFEAIPDRPESGLEPMAFSLFQDEGFLVGTLRFMSGEKKSTLAPVLFFRGDGTELLAAAQQTEDLRDTEQSNLRQIAIACALYAKAHEGRFPPLDPRPGRLILARVLYPQFISDPSLLVSPALPSPPARGSDPDAYADAAFDDHSFWYIPYALSNEAEGLAFVEAYRKGVAEGKVPDDDLTVTTPEGDVTLHRLREGVERDLAGSGADDAAVAAARARIPVLIGRPGLYPDGANVLFLDGHTEFMRYPGPFPMSERFVKALKSLDGAPLR